ncbi:Hypothetical predicted protein [Mytilus galloprovincialis]|uniref:Reverse transcriptase domain-containing protein n=1 Tax=Mytilus galloprovincialis TaxID=29158 RepID=A0A8B6FYG1_MYTGA|nr:Hypothetical predicted protein [Mytilus galloprovincialis]
MNHIIKRLIRKRQRRYNTAKNYDTSENWEKNRKARDIVKQTMTEAHDKYIRGILNDESANEEQKRPTMGKKFWQYIKSRKKDTVNMSTLKNSSGTEVIDSKGKAAILNEQYDSVFTDEDMNTMPSLGNSNIDDIEILRVNTIESVARSLDMREQIVMLVLDFFKAFDTVTHQRLLQKMSYYGIRGDVLGTVTNILQTLGWPTIATRRQGTRLILLHKILHGEASVIIPDYIRRPTVTTRQYHRDRFSRVSTSTDAYTVSSQEQLLTGTNATT